MILIYSKDVDELVNQVIDYLPKGCVRIGSRDHLEFENIIIGENSAFTISSEYFDSVQLEYVSSIWFNGGSVFSKKGLYDSHCGQSLVDAFLDDLKVSKIGATLKSYETNKLYYSLEAKRQGFCVPETLITGRKGVLKPFYSKHRKNNGLICKRITDRLIYQNKEHIYDMNSTFEIDEEVFAQIPESFGLSLFQERIVAEFEIRMAYLAGEFYGMAIHSFNDEIDHRTNLNTSQSIRTVPFKAPEELTLKLQRLLQNLNLNYGSIDLLYANGEYYFLEINPTGQMSYLNEACNYYLDKVISKELCHGK